MDVEDNEVLIAMVFDRPALWDKRNKFYSSRKVVDKSWKEISLEMKQDEYKLRKKWRYLRDQFAVEFGKIPPSQSGDDHISVGPKWPYFKLLHFLKDVVKPRVTRSRFASSVHSDQDASVLDGPSAHHNEFYASSSPRNQEDDNETYESKAFNIKLFQPPVKRYKNSYDDKILDIEQRKLQFLQDRIKSRQSRQNEDNEHLLFFKSLLPHVDQIPPHMVLTFRNRIQHVVEEFAYRSHVLHNNPSSSDVKIL